MIELGTIIYYLVLGVIVFSLMVFFHELGHSFFINRYLREKVKIKWGFETTVGTKAQMNRLTNQQYKMMLMGGILGGFIPFFLTYDAFIPQVNLMLFLGYIWASKSDIRNIIKK